MSLKEGENSFKDLAVATNGLRDRRVDVDELGNRSRELMNACNQSILPPGLDALQAQIDAQASRVEFFANLPELFGTFMSALSSWLVLGTP